jgi:crotonobetainyl-CoA:carnitine CoA-transferase CaiB-like acyl-CoA transferase
MAGLRVLELGAWVAGPAAGLVLADWGADVVKVEPPGVGDPGRLFARLLASMGADLPFNPPFEMDNRGKRSIALDLASEEGRALGMELVDGADVLVTNIRQSALARLGFDPAAVMRRNPRLVYAAITGYGMDGPDSDRAAYDISAFWARSGIAHMLTSPGQAPPFQRGGMGDHNAGMAAAGGVAAALYEREKTGRGRLVTTSLLREGIFTMSFDLAITLRFGVPLQVADRLNVGNPCINNYQDSEGRWFWVVGLDPDRHWPPMARAVGHPEWIDDPRYATFAARRERSVELIEELDGIFAGKPLAEWAEIFDSVPDMWWAPVQTLDEVIADPQARAAGSFCEVPDPAGGTLTFPATPVDFDGQGARPACMAPVLGEHSDDLLAELGRDGDEIKRLREAGVVA